MSEENRCEDMIQTVEENPGLTVSKLEMEKVWPRSGVKEAAEYIAMETNTDLEWDQYGNPRFMPKDQARVLEIRGGWSESGLDPNGYDIDGRKKS